MAPIITPYQYLESEGMNVISAKFITKLVKLGASEIPARFTNELN